MHELAHEFTSRKISPWGGIKFFHGTYVRSGFREMLQKSPLPSPGSNRGYNPVDLVEGFLCSVVLGSKRLAHTGMLRTDEVVKEIFGWSKGMADQSTFSRFFKKHSIDLNDRIFPEVMRNFYKNIELDRMTIDIDSTVITRYGEQENAKVGYNPQKRGRRSHHPILAFCDELAMVVNAWMRTGDSVSTTDATQFIDELFSIIPTERIGLMRFDAGFYSQNIMEKLESQTNPVHYIIRAKMTSGIVETIQQIKDWYANDDVSEKAQYGVAYYKASGWNSARKMIVVRIPKSQQSDTPVLFEEMAEYGKYEYKAFITNVEFSASVVHGLYNKRANAENRIKELKYDYGIEGFALTEFGAMEGAFRYVMLAYNIMQLFKIKVMLTQKGTMLSTIKFQCIAIGSYVVTNGRKRILKLAAQGKQKHFLQHFFSNIEVLKPPFQFSNA